MARTARISRAEENRLFSERREALWKLDYVQRKGAIVTEARAALDAFPLGKGW